jgi:peptide/nickel transport system ATP-binding protein
VTESRLVVEDLEVRIAGTGVAVIDEVSFGLEAGEVLGLVGESGSGKTTVGLALLAHARRGLQIAGGRVRLDGQDLLDMDARSIERIRGRDVSYVAQDPATALNPALTIGSQLREILRRHTGLRRHEQAKRIAEMLDEVRLTEHAATLQRYPHELSGGQLQRVSLAMAFACRPRVIVFDEPTTGLDVTTQRHVLNTISELCEQRGVAGVYVSHDLAVVAEIANQVAIMYAGRIVEQGGARPVFDHPAHPYTRRLLEAVPSVDQRHRLHGVPGHPPRPGQRPAGCSFAPRCDFAVAACLTQPPPPRVLTPARSVRCVRAEQVIARAKSETFELVGERAMKDAATPAISVSGVSAAYGDRPVLKDVSFSIDDGECVAIVGESGSGKTTIARCIVGLHGSWSGEIALQGTALAQRVTQRTLPQLQAMQYVFQNPYASLNPRRTIRQLVEQPLRRLSSVPRSDVDGRVTAAFEAAALPLSFLDRYPGELSGGERQRVAIARSLVVEPRVLICDEVTSALDVSVQASVVELLRELQSIRGVAILFITHDLPLVGSIAQRTIVLNQGEVVEQGATEDLLAHPQHPYTIELLTDAPRLTQRGTAAETVT